MCVEHVKERRYIVYWYERCDVDLCCDYFEDYCAEVNHSRDDGMAVQMFLFIGKFTPIIE